MNRLFLAGGGYSSVYLGSVFSYAYLLRLQMAAGLNYNFASKMLIGAPLFVAGFFAGVYAFGDSHEFKHLLRHYPTYRKEFKTIRNDLYYN